MRKVTASELLAIVGDGGQVLMSPPESAPTLDLGELIAAVQSIQPVELGELIEAVRGVTVKVDVPAPQVVVQEQARPSSWDFDIERNGRGQMTSIKAMPNYVD